MELHIFCFARMKNKKKTDLLTRGQRSEVFMGLWISINS